MTRYAKILKADIANGIGFRTTIFFTGCPFRCKGCFNSSIWDPSTGKEYTAEVQEKVLKECRDLNCRGLSLLGGEPTADWNIETVIGLCKQFKEELPKKDIWMWSGRLMKEIKELPKGEELLSYLDVVIDGPFVQELHDMKLKWKGSSNQTIWRKRLGKWTKDLI